MAFLSNIFGNANDRYIKSLQPTIDRINSLEENLKKLSDEELKTKTADFKKRLAEGQTLEDILPEAFAAVREASRRTLGQRHYDVQLIGGIVLHQGKIAQMRTGEGKTLVATLPTYLNALTGGGVHVVTVNPYLARRDATWMGQIYNALGLTVGCVNPFESFLYDASHTTKAEDVERDTEGSFKVVHEFMRPVDRRQAYAADITYGTNNEFGFDYLRDNMIYAPEQMAQRKHHFAIVDEVDSILIDEARTPLIISAPDEDSGELYQTFARIVPKLIADEDYTIDIKDRNVSITDSGIEKVEKDLGMQNIYDEGGIKYVHHLEQALKAEALFKLDQHYVVKNGEVTIVDEFTGRLMQGRRWSDGLHQAVEAKEGVKIEKETKTLGTITFQNYFRLYGKLGGMTGTAQTSAEEFHKVYKLDVVTIPTNKPAVRKDLPDRIYKNEAGKFRAIVQEIKERNKIGQPVLVGTVSIERNEYLSLMLEREGIKYEILNAKNHEREAEIIAQAGRFGAVTLATNIAGRGVDIILGGNPSSPEEAAKVRDAGGLHVLGTERHEARRIDDQLRGRAGRQGDPGSSQFFVSTEDELVRRFGGDRLKNIMERLGVAEDDVIENRFISSAIQQAQSRIEGHNFDARKQTLEYDDVLNKQRTTIYGLRNQVLLEDQAHDIVHQWLEEANKIPQVESFGDNAAEASPQEDLVKKYAQRELELGPEQARLIEKLVLLRTIDEHWVEHLTAMDYLRGSVSLRAYGQRDPLAEYKVEGQGMFVQLMSSIKAQVIDVIFKVTLAPAPQIRQNAIEGRGQPMGQSAVEKESSRQEPQHTDHPELGRNDPCPCGAINPATGEVYKWKKCGMIKAPHHKVN